MRLVNRGPATSPRGCSCGRAARPHGRCRAQRPRQRAAARSRRGGVQLGTLSLHIAENRARSLRHRVVRAHRSPCCQCEQKSCGVQPLRLLWPDARPRHTPVRHGQDPSGSHCVPATPGRAGRGRRGPAPVCSPCVPALLPRRRSGGPSRPSAHARVRPARRRGESRGDGGAGRGPPRRRRRTRPPGPGLGAVTIVVMGFRWSPPIWTRPRKIWWPATRRGGESSRPSPAPVKSWVWARPAIGHAAPWNGRCRSG